MALIKLTEGLSRKSVDLTGQRFDRLTVVGFGGKDNLNRPLWSCKCDCGAEKLVRANALLRGGTKSCGCLRVERRKTHGLSKTPEYVAYIDAMARCTNPKVANFNNYGGRGICFKFKSFEEFIADIGHRPSADYSIDRIDNNGHYEVGNVRWATRHEQLCNRRSFKREWREATEKAKKYQVNTPDGETLEVFNMAKFCREHGLDKANLHRTISSGGTHLGYSAQPI